MASLIVVFAEVADDALLSLKLVSFFRIVLASSEQKPSDNSGEDAGALKTFQYAAWFMLVFSICAQVCMCKQEGLRDSYSFMLKYWKRK